MAVGTTAALIGGAALSGGTGIASSLIQQGAINRATDAQVQANQQAIALQEKALDLQNQQSEKALAFLQSQSDQARADLQPFRDIQLQATQDLQALADPNSALFQQQRTEGTQAIQRQLAAQGLLRSGAQGDQLGRLETGLAQTRANILGGLSGTGAAGGLASLASGLGQSGAGVLGQQSQNIGSTLAGISGLLAGQGQAIGQGAIGGANAIAGGLANVNNNIQSTIAALLQQNQLAQNGTLFGALGGK